MDKLKCMKAFIAVVEANGFSNAARRGNSSKALLSKYVGQLEDRLSIRLLQRTTRHVSLTEVGRAYYEQCRPLLEQLDELDANVDDIHLEPSGELRITAPVSFSELHLMHWVSVFTDQYPRIRIRLSLTDRMIDLVEEGFDIALRIGHLPDSSLIARRMGTVRLIAYASQGYLDQYGMPEQPEELLQHRCIIDSNYRDGTSWLFERKGQTSKIFVKGSCYVNSPTAVMALVKANNGIAVGPDFVVSGDIETGELVPVLPDYQLEASGLYAIYPHRQYLPTKIKLFIELLASGFNTEHPINSLQV